MNLYSDVVYVFCELMRLFVIMKYYNIFFEQKGKKLLKWLLLSGIYIMTLLVFWIFQNVWLNALVTYLELAGVVFLYKGQIQKKLIFSITLFAVSILTDILASFIISSCPDVRDLSIIGSVISVLLFLAGVILSEQLSDNCREEFKDKIGLFMLVIPVFSIGCIFVIVCDEGCSRKGIIIVSSILLLMNMTIYCFYDKVTKHYLSLIENKNLKNQLLVYENQLRLNVEYETKIRMLNHDMKYHLNELKRLWKQNCKDGCAEYLNNMQESVKFGETFVKTNNISLDGVLNYMAARAQQKGIMVEFSISVPHDLRLNAFDLNIILGNLMENAIEAASKVKNSKISVNIRYKYENIFIIIKNDYNGIVNIKNGQYMTTKQDKDEHGIGFQSIKHIMDKYHGTYLVRRNDKQFGIEVMLYLADNNEK